MDKGCHCLRRLKQISNTKEISNMKTIGTYEQETAEFARKYANGPVVTMKDCMEAVAAEMQAVKKQIQKALKSLKGDPK